MMLNCSLYQTWHVQKHVSLDHRESHSQLNSISQKELEDMPILFPIWASSLK